MIKLAMKLAPSAMKLIQSTLLLINVCHFFFVHEPKLCVYFVGRDSLRYAITRAEERAD